MECVRAIALLCSLLSVYACVCMHPTLDLDLGEQDLLHKSSQTFPARKEGFARSDATFTKPVARREV